MLFQKTFNRLTDNRGFTLIEIAIVLLIVGLTLGMSAQFVKAYMEKIKFDTTLENIELTQDALYEFYAQNGRYPCPADPTLSQNDAEYGIEHCKNPVTPGCVADGVLCTNVGSGDPENDGANDFVMVGALPIRTISEDLSLLGLDTVPVESSAFRAHHAFDGYGMKLTYAVTEQLANPVINNVLQPANSNLGAIRLIDENNVNLTTPPSTAQYIVVSHGLNNEGAHTKNGNIIPDCTVYSYSGATPTPAPPGPSPSGNASEKENCDNNDAIFLKGTRSFADNDFYFDDLISFKPSGRVQLWIKVPADVAGQSYITNTNLGRVGVGLDTPDETLHIAGDISAQKGTYAQGYCKQDGTDCIDPDDIAGTGFKCPAGQIARGIHDENNDDRIILRCENVFVTVPVGQSCPGGQAIQSMTYQSDGTITLNCVAIGP